jgi:hypothetical protein
MALDRRVVRALEEAVAEAGEDPPLATKLVALMEEMANGNVRLTDRDAATRHIELLYEEVSDQTLNE